MAAPAVEATAATALRSVILRARKAAEQVGRDPERVRVIAVSKTKPVSLIRQIYDAGHRCFGENYVQEIIDKAPQVQRSRIIYDFQCYCISCSSADSRKGVDLSSPFNSCFSFNLIIFFLCFDDANELLLHFVWYTASWRYRVALRGAFTEQQSQDLIESDFNPPILNKWLSKFLFDLGVIKWMLKSFNPMFAAGVPNLAMVHGVDGEKVT